MGNPSHRTTRRGRPATTAGALGSLSPAP